MQGFRQVPAVFIIGQGKISGEISLEDDYNIAVSVENYATSPNQLKIGLNDAALIPCDAGDRAREFRALEACGVPCYFKGKLKWAFAANDAANFGLVIITKLVPELKDIPQPS